jgi:hypothetical protein
MSYAFLSALSGVPHPAGEGFESFDATFFEGSLLEATSLARYPSSKSKDTLSM